MADPVNNDIELGTIGSVSTKTSEIKVGIREWNGSLGVDIRRYNNTFPTKKGIRIKPDEISQAITFLERAEQELKKQGILK